MSHDISKIVNTVVETVLSDAATGTTKRASLAGEAVQAVSSLTLAAARELIRAVEQKAAELGVKAVVAVANASGNPIAVECMDDAYIASYDIALNKAFTVTALKMSTQTLSELAAPGGSLYGIQFTGGGKIVIFGGGEPLLHAGSLVGGLGVSGGTAEQDTALAAYGKQYFESKIG